MEVIDPLSADILNLDVISDHFEPAVPTIIDHVWGFFTGKIKLCMHQHTSYWVCLGRCY